MPDAPLVLAFDTSAAHCAAALLSEDTLLAQHVEARDRGQAERLFPILEELLQGADFGFRDLRALGVGTGPGNFTGLRISVSAARGLALGLGIPAVGVSGFETALALTGRHDGALWLPGPRGMAYRADVAAGRIGAPELVEAREDAAITRIDWANGGIAALARCAAARLAAGDAVPRPAPLYVKAADAAPARDAAPAILP